MYCFEDRVSYSRIDEKGLLKPHEIINSLQDCALFHSEEVGRSCVIMKEEGMAWLLNYWNVRIVRRPAMNERFSVSTWVYQVKGIFARRGFLIETMDQEPLVHGISRWFYFQHKTGMPVKPKQIDLDVYTIEKEAPFVEEKGHIPVPEDLQLMQTYEVNPGFLDTNVHMNNSEYVKMACGVLDLGEEVTGLRVEYHQAAKNHDVIQVYAHRDPEGVTVSLRNPEGMEYATCRMEIQNSREGNR